MYETTLIVHSLLRWAVVLTGLYSVALALNGVIGKRLWSPGDIGPHRWFIIALDTQFLVGVVLYGVISPLVSGAMSNVGEAMKTPALRYWLVEHPLPMLIALGLAHLGFARAKRTAAVSSHRHILLHYGVALIVILASTPWPFVSNARPWLRFW